MWAKAHEYKLNDISVNLFPVCYWTLSIIRITQDDSPTKGQTTQGQTTQGQTTKGQTTQGQTTKGQKRDKGSNDTGSNDKRSKNATKGQIFFNSVS